jgi:hypothetical protein
MEVDLGTVTYAEGQADSQGGGCRAVVLNS